MQEKERTRILRELFRVSRLSMEAAELVLPKIRDLELKSQIERQRDAYQAASEKSAELLRRNGLDPAGAGGMAERLLRGSVRLGTAWSRSPRQIARIAIDGTAAAMMDLTRTMDRSADDDLESRKLAEQYLDAGQRDIDRLRKYL